MIVGWVIQRQKHHISFSPPFSHPLVQPVLQHVLPPEREQLRHLLRASHQRGRGGQRRGSDLIRTVVSFTYTGTSKYGNECILEL